MRNKLLIISFLAFSCNLSFGQVCNSCSLETVKEMLSDAKIEFNEQFDSKGEKFVVTSTNDYMKSWFFKYDMCYLYKITVLNKDQFKNLVKLMNQQYQKLNQNSWSDSETIVDLKNNNGYYEFCFHSKLSYISTNK